MDVLLWFDIILNIELMAVQNESTVYGTRI